MGGATGNGERIDLSETPDFFLALKQSADWRERVVGELRLGLRNHIRAVSSYQVSFPPELVEEFVDGDEDVRTANVLMPLTAREKRPLLNLGVAGPGGCPATVTARASIAALQTIYLASLAEQSGAADRLTPLVDERLWEAICAFSPSFFVTNAFSRAKAEMAPALADYLSSGLDFSVSERQVRKWRSVTTVVGRSLAAALGEPPDSFSSSEEALLALPNMSPLPTSAAEIDKVIEQFAAAIGTAERYQEDALITALAEYGRRYELIVEVEVPLLEPCRLRVEEDLPLELQRSGMQYWARQTVALGDARSAHIEARLDDPNVELPELRDEVRDRGVQVKDLGGDDATGWLEAIRVTREAMAVYSSEPNRPRYVEIAFRLRLARHVMAATAVLIALNFVAMGFVWAIGSSEELASRLAVLVVPTTIGATFVLVREQTALANRLQAIPRAVLAASVVALWLAVCLQLAVFETEAPEAGGEIRPAHAPDLPQAGSQD